MVMENYDADFHKHVREGDIIVSGYNFGTGSSREQAATALKYKGIQMVVAGSFSATYQRNAINNGYLVLQSPKLIDYVRKNPPIPNYKAGPTIRMCRLSVDFEVGNRSRRTQVPTPGVGRGRAGADSLRRTGKLDGGAAFEIERCISNICDVWEE